MLPASVDRDAVDFFDAGRPGLDLFQARPAQIPHPFPGCFIATRTIGTSRNDLIPTAFKQNEPHPFQNTFTCHLVVAPGRASAMPLL